MEAHIRSADNPSVIIATRHLGKRRERHASLQANMISQVEQSEGVRTEVTCAQVEKGECRAVRHWSPRRGGL